MFIYIFSIVMIVASNVFYNVSQKSTPSNVNPLVSLLITYTTAGVFTLIAYFFSKTEYTFLESFKQLNWTSYVLGFSIVGLELGYLLAYRAGWDISIGSLVANISLAVILIPVGIFFYNEAFDIQKVIGIALCLFGLILINK